MTNPTALIAEARGMMQRHEQVPTNLAIRLADALESVTAERDGLASIIEQAKAWQRGFVAEPKTDSPTVTYAEWTRRAANHLAAILSTAPADALRAVKRDVWNEGHAVGFEQGQKPTRIDLAGNRNPYDDPEQEAGQK